ncbi:alpha-mannosidase [Paraliobacillus salinarum]|uniref:alpha-mannosidase n=1 Tax=Paraliobacillus salinarum TaxID=1158996 RepID=UPI0015F61411|nr:alpha-mannosidase [Paraliobacillus salinarum]
MFLTEKKVNNRINELSEYRYRDRMCLKDWQFVVDDGEIGAYPSSKSTSNAKTVSIGEHWKGRDLYAWLSSVKKIPEEWSGKKVVGVFDFGNTGGGNNSGFESLLFINGEPFQGVDSNHKEVFLNAEHIGSSIAFDFRLWSGMEGGGEPQIQEFKFKRADLAWLDEKVDKYYFDTKTIIETVETLTDDKPERHKLLTALNQSLNKINWLNPGSDAFYESVYEAEAFLTEQMATIEKSHDVTFHCIGHTHIDVAWLWQLKHTREKSARSFSTVLRLMEQYPEYLFLQSQPQLYEYIKEDYPDIYQQMKKRIKEQRWETDGGMWLEADCNIPSGESLVRQLLLGSNFLREEFNKETEYLWLPDVFGYSWALPQILKKSGIKTFMTTKISWSQFNRMPHDTFHWRGIDGSEILTHFITTTEPWPESTYYTYNGYITPKVIHDSWDEYKDKNINQDLLLSYGYGDGGGGVNREMLETMKRIDDMPGLPYAKPSRADDYFKRLHETVDNTNEYVHTWDGELYLEFHRGTYTSQAFMKRMNRKLELLYRNSEWLNVIDGLHAKSAANYPAAQLTAGWKTILRNQFHDIIPGSSIKEVYEDAKQEYEEAEQIGNEAWNLASSHLIQDETNPYVWTIFNSAPWNRDDLIFIAVDEAGRFKDEAGHVLEAQYTNGGYDVKVNNIPSMGYAPIYFEPTETPSQLEEPFTIYDKGIRTPYYDIAWNEQGHLVQIYDREQNREVLAPNSRGNVLQIFEDKPLMFDAWDIDIFYQEKMEEVTELMSIECVEKGNLKTVIRFKWKYASTVVEQDMIVYTGTHRIDFKTYVDWQERQRLMKVAFPVDIRSTEATYDIQYGNVKRPTHWNTSWDYARFETVGHQWADLSEGGYGVSLLNDCKYGYDIKDNVMRLSLLKSATHPDPLADKGEHQFTYSLFPHADSWIEGNTVKEAWHLNSPLTCSSGVIEEKGKSLLHCTADHVMIDAVKKAEYSDAVVIRIHEYAGKRTNASLFGDWKIESWKECDLMERPIDGSEGIGNIDFYIQPYEIKTFLVTFAK